MVRGRHSHPDLNNFIGILTQRAVGGVKQEDGGNFVIRLVVMVTVTQFQSGDQWSQIERIIMFLCCERKQVMI